MKIFVIAAKLEGEETPWIVNAWDEWTVDANYKGWLDAIEKANRENSGSEIRVAEIEVPESFLFDMFKPIRVKGTVVEDESEPEEPETDADPGDDHCTQPED